MIYLTCALVLVSLIVTLIWNPLGAVRAMVISVFVLGLLSLLSFELLYQWKLRSALALAFAGGAVLETYSCLAILTGILGNGERVE